MITLNQNMEIEQNNVMRILIVLLFIFLLEIFFERWFDTSNYDENDKRPLPIGKNKNVYGFLKGELRGKIMKE